MQVIIPRRIVTFKRSQLDKWITGDREDCIDDYCRGLPGSYGFGEFIGGKYYESLGYN